MKCRVWLKYGTRVKNADQKQLTSKVPSVKGFCDFVKTGWDGYNRKLRWSLYIKKQRAYDYARKKISFGLKEENVIIAYGDGALHHASRGHVPAPTKTLFQKLKSKLKWRCRKVDEFRTSKLCRNCNSELEQKKAWTSKFCHGCNKLVDRDINAALNIGDLLVYQNENNGKIPEAFTRSNSAQHDQGRTSMTVMISWQIFIDKSRKTRMLDIIIACSEFLFI
ncbi:hypothetical protein MP638_004809 [Amoeboaphelidium occidentale]|nr:hypothetical protein MP638_004809 [Amoeboaphelidium occidentale]